MKNTLARLNTARSRRMSTEDIATADRLRAAGEAAVAAQEAPLAVPVGAPVYTPDTEYSCSYHHECSPENITCEQYVAPSALEMIEADAMIAAPVVLSETYEVSEAEFTAWRRDALEAGYKITTSVFLSAGYQVTISRTLPTELDALEASHTDGDFTHGRVR